MNSLNRHHDAEPVLPRHQPALIDVRHGFLLRLFPGRSDLLVYAGEAAFKAKSATYGAGVACGAGGFGGWILVWNVCVTSPSAVKATKVTLY